MEKPDEMLFEAFEFLLSLKNIKRPVWVDRKVDDPESIAEQSFQSIAIAMVLADKYNLNFEKIVRMMILQDMATAIAGDVTPYDKLYFGKYAEHKDAIENLIACIPKDQRSVYRGLWEEYYSKQSLESQVAKDILRIELCLQALEYEIKGYKKMDAFWDETEKKIQTEELREMFNKLIEFKKKRLET